MSAQLEEAWTVNLVDGGLSPSCARLTKILWQVFNPKIAGSFESRSKLRGLMYQNNIMCTLRICLCPSHIGQVIRLSGAVPPDVLRFASLRITLTAFP